MHSNRKRIVKSIFSTETREYVELIDEILIKVVI